MSTIKCTELKHLEDQSAERRNQICKLKHSLGEALKTIADQKKIIVKLEARLAEVERERDER